MTIDVYAFRDDGDVYATQVLADEKDSGRTVAGTNKLAQRFVLQLLTVKGSVPGDDQAGCEFVSRLVQGGVASELDVFTAFNASVGPVVAALQAQETADDPDDERLAGVQVNRLVLSPGHLTLDVTLRTRADTMATLSLPLNFVFGE
jgi:hypothetical protein